MLDQNKKILERNILDHFRDHCPDFPKGRIIPSESPDFIIKTSPKRSVGIELSSLPSLSYQIKNKTDLEQFISDMRSIISKKEEKIKLYKKKAAHEYWLILHLDSLSAGNFNVFNHLQKFFTEFSFDRIILFDLFKGKILFKNR